MSMKSKLSSAVLGLALVAASGASAMAYEARTTSALNVRSGPSTAFAVVEQLRGGESVDVDRCRGSWCFVDFRGGDGWVSASYLTRGGEDRGRDYRRDRDFDDRDFDRGRDTYRAYPRVYDDFEYGYTTGTEIHISVGR